MSPVLRYIAIVSAELIGIRSVGVALAGLIVTVGGLALSAMRDLRAEMRVLESCVGTVEKGQARIEGLLEGAGWFRAAAAPDPAGD